MRTNTEPKAHAAKRDLFAELSEGVTALAQARQGQRTLGTRSIPRKPAPRRPLAMPNP